MPGMKKTIALVFLFLGCCYWAAQGCTSAVVSGRATPDGRPLLWKHRDSSDQRGRIVHFPAQDGKFEFVGLVNGSDASLSEVWTGYNSCGFAVMNTASYNLKQDTVSLADREGFVMKQALATCRTLADFDSLLRRLPRPLGVEANFGAIDAEGGAAYFEVNNDSVYRFDVADAEQGYLIRTNYSVAGRKDGGLGYIRYENAERLFSVAAAEKRLTPEYLMQSVSRSFYHTLLGRDFCGEEWAVDQDFIPRRTTSAVLVVEGVLPGESPRYTTMWTVLGYPPCSVALPVWLGVKNGIPAVLCAAKSTEDAPLCLASSKLKCRAFPIVRGSGKHYLHIGVLYNSDGNGFMQRLVPVEQEVYRKSRKLLERYRQAGLPLPEKPVGKLQAELSRTVMAELNRLEIQEQIK